MVKRKKGVARKSLPITWGNPVYCADPQIILSKIFNQAGMADVCVGHLKGQLLVLCRPELVICELSGCSRFLTLLLPGFLLLLVSASAFCCKNEVT